MVLDDTKGHLDITKDIMTNSAIPSKSEVSTDENTEHAPETSTITADVTLILSGEGEADLCVNATEEPVKQDPQPVNVAKPKRPGKDGSKSVWVSNISRTTKASDLKKLFSENFKVESAKIVTNGKSFFGYISLETAEMVQKSVKALNEFNLAGRIISVSLMRPDLKAARTNVGEQGKRGKQLNFTESQKINENKQEDKNETNKELVKDVKEEIVEKSAVKKAEGQVNKTSPKDKLKRPQRQDTKPDRKDAVIENLKKELNTVNSELRITKRRLRDSDNRLAFERTRKSELINEVSKLKLELKSEKRKMDQEREQTEKKRKLDQIRYEDDSATLNKELEECKKLREYLQIKADEMRPRHRSRSPIRRSPMRRVGPGGRSLPIRRHGSIDRGHGDMDKITRSRIVHASPPKQRGYHAAPERQCIPPSPPKINRRSSPPRRDRERSPLYKAHKKIRMDYPSNSYSSGPNEGNKALLPHYPTTNLLEAASRSVSYKMPYRYSPTPAGRSAYPLVGGNLIQQPRFNSTRPMEYQDYPKRMPAGPRKF